MIFHWFWRNTCKIQTNNIVKAILNVATIKYKPITSNVFNNNTKKKKRLYALIKICDFKGRVKNSNRFMCNTSETNKYNSKAKTLLDETHRRGVQYPTLLLLFFFSSFFFLYKNVYNTGGKLSKILYVSYTKLNCDVFFFFFLPDLSRFYMYLYINISSATASRSLKPPVYTKHIYSYISRITRIQENNNWNKVTFFFFK